MEAAARMKAAATAVERRNEVAELDRCFFILCTIKSRTIYIAAAILVVKRLRYDRVRFIVTVLARLGSAVSNSRLRPVV